MKPQNNSWIKWLVLTIIAIVLVCCCAGALISYFAFKNYIDESRQMESALSNDFHTPVLTATVQPTIEILDEVQRKYLSISSVEIPPADSTEIAFQLGDVFSQDRSKTTQPEILSEGTKATFWVMNQDTEEINEKNATLRMVTPHVYFWIQDGKAYDSSDLQALGNTFENEIYPKVKEIFGSEWTPGVDNDEHIYILYTNGVGNGIAGVFSSDDSLLKDVNTYSNEHEMFYISGSEDLSELYTYGVLAHEFNHMILWNKDRNEDTWMAEGLADLALTLVGYDEGGFDFIFAENPDLQLNTWPEDSEAQDAHYGASYLFLTYLYSRFGERFIQEIMTIPQNGWEGVDVALSKLAANNSTTGEPLKAEQVFGDWVAANYLNDPRIGSGQFSYSSDLIIPAFSDTENSPCLPDWQERTVNQFGADYIRLDCSGYGVLEFEGESTVKLIQELENDENHFFWSNRSDLSQTSITREFQLPDGADSYWMEYRVWYDLEDGYDYGYLLAKSGDTPWKILEPTSCTEFDPVQANLGCGYTGFSSGWQAEKVDLSEYAGEKVTLKFLTLTDGAVNNQGLLIDDIAIPAINYQADFESDVGGWDARGWAIVQNELPQSFEVSIIRNEGDSSVDRFSVQKGQKISTGVQIKPGEEVILVVSGTTRFITTPANYRFRFVTTP